MPGTTDDGDAVADTLLDGVVAGVLLAVELDEQVIDCSAVVEGESLRVAVPEAVTLMVAVLDGVTLIVGVLDGVTLMVGVLVGVTLMDGVRVGVTLMVGVFVGERVGMAVTLGVLLGVPSAVCTAEALAVATDEGVAVPPEGVVEAEGTPTTWLLEGLADGVGVGVGLELGELLLLRSAAWPGASPARSTRNANASAGSTGWDRNVCGGVRKGSRRRRLATTSPQRRSMPRTVPMGRHRA